MPPRLSHTPYSKLPKPKTSLNRSPQRPQAGARRQTNNYITPLPKPLGRYIIPASPKDPLKRGRSQGESNRPGLTPAKHRHQPHNLRGVPLPPAAGSTSQSASTFELPQIAELREQYNQTPSPERLPPCPAVVRFAAIAEFASPLESKQQHQRQQQHLRSRIPVQGTATDSLSPRKLFGSRDAAKSQPLIQSDKRRREVTTSRNMGCGKEEASSSPVMASEEALTPMYFTMQYKNNRSQVFARFERPEPAVVETGYTQVDEPGVLERNKPIQGEDWIDPVAQGGTSEGSPRDEEYIYPHCVESKYNRQAAREPTVALPGKQASKSLGYLGNLSTRNVSWGNNISKVANNKAEGATQAAEKLEEKRNFMKRTGTVLDRVRKFEALGSGIPNDLQQPTPTHPVLATSGVGLPDGKPSGSELKKWYTNSKSNLRQYFQEKGKETSTEDIAPPNQRRQSCAGGTVRRRVSEATENIKLQASKSYQRSNPEETYKYQNPDGGRFPPWPKNNGVEVAKKGPVKASGSSMIDARRRKTDTSFLPLPSEARPGQQSVVGSLRSDAPKRIGSHVDGITPNLEVSEWRCSMAYWAGRFSTVRDAMRQEILAMEYPAESSLVYVDDWHQEFVEVVFQRLFDSIKEDFSTPNGVGYSEKQMAYLREYQKNTMKVVAIRARRRFFSRRQGDDDDD